jgi:hypothetical protein
VRGGVGEHPPQQLAIVGLQLRALVEFQARLADSRRQLVAHPLQLAEAEHPGLAAHAADPALDRHPAEGFREQARQLPLEAADLPPQLGASEALACAGAKRRGAGV